MLSIAMLVLSSVIACVGDDVSPYGTDFVRDPDGLGWTNVAYVGPIAPEVECEFTVTATDVSGACAPAL